MAKVRGNSVLKKMASSSKQYDIYQVLAILLASDDDSIHAFGNNSSLKESADDFEYDEPCIRDADVHFPSQTQV